MRPTNSKERNISFWTYTALLVFTFSIFGFSVYIYAYTPKVENENARIKLIDQNQLDYEMGHLLKTVDTLNSILRTLEKTNAEYKAAYRNSDYEEMGKKNLDFEQRYNYLRREIVKGFDTTKSMGNFDKVEGVKEEVGYLYNQLLLGYASIMELRKHETELTKKSETWRNEFDKLHVELQECEEKSSGAEAAQKDDGNTIKELEEKLQQCRTEKMDLMFGDKKRKKK